ncbi:MAG: hypothetical protein U0V48_14285 [Anaerolineales bacterium]
MFTVWLIYLLEKSKDFVRRDVLHREAAFESHPRIVEESGQRVAVGLEFPRRVFHRHIADAEQDERLALTSVSSSSMMWRTRASMSARSAEVSSSFQNRRARRGGVNVFVFGEFVS